MLYRVFLLALLSVSVCGQALGQTWQSIAPMLDARMEFRAIQLNDGRILVAGGQGPWTACELYDPVTDTWSRTGSLNEGRRAYEMQKLPDGKILIMGGLSPGTISLSSCEIYDPGTGTWRYTVPMIEGRHIHGSLVMPDGKILVEGGMDVGGPATFSSSCEIFDPVLEKWTELPSMPIGCYANAPHYSASENKLYVCSGVIGGFGGAYTQNVQVFDFEAQTWTAGSPLTVGHADDEMQSGLTLNDSYILFAGRDAPSTTTNVVEYFDQFSQTWKRAGQLPAAHWQGMAFPIGADSFIVLGGVEDPGPYQRTLDAVSWFSYKDRKGWAGNSMIDPRYRFAGLVVALPFEDVCRDIKTIYVFGGGTPDVTDHCEKLVLGPRLITDLVSVDPSRLFIQHSLCSKGGDTSIRFVTKSCEPLSLDTIEVLGSGLTVTSSSLPLDLGVTDTVAIPLHVEGREGDRTPVRMVFKTPAGNIERFIYVTLMSTGTAGKLSLSASPASPRSICTAAVDSVTLLNTMCDSARIESITFTGADAAEFVATGVGESANSDGSATIHYILDAIDPRTYTATMVIVTNSNGHRDTLRQAITVQATGGNAVIGRTVMTDRRVKSGDTVQVPLKLVTTSKTTAQGAEVDLQFDKDLLELLPPDFDGTLADGSEDYDINLTPRGARLYLPGSIRVENGTIVNLRFRTFVTKNYCTTVKLSSLLFSPDDPKFTACVLSTNLDSAIICLDPQCGDNEIRDYLNGKSPQITVISSAHAKELQLHGWRSPTVEVYSILGERMAVDISTQGEKVTISSDELPSGTYHARVSEGGVVRSVGFAIQR